MLQTTPPDPAALARRPDTSGPLAVATPTTRKLADASISVNTRRAYLGALARLDAWRGPAPLTDARLAAYLGAIFEAGRAPATAALAVAAVRFRATLAGQPDPAGAATARVLGGYRRTAADRGRGQAAPLRADGLAAILATAERPRTDGRGVESHTTAHRRGRLDAVIAGLLFMGGLRRSEVAALRWVDVTDATDGDGVLVTVRTSKTNQEGDAADVRYLKNGPANAIRTLRAADAEAAPTDRVIGLSPVQIQRRFTTAARAAGIEARVTAHSGRVGLASELTARGASTTEVMLAGNWKTARMVAHYLVRRTQSRGLGGSRVYKWPSGAGKTEIPVCREDLTMWKRDEAVKPTSGQSTPTGSVVPSQGSKSNIGKSVVIKGELNGSEDLTIEGEVEGKIELKDHVLTIGPNGKIRAQVFAKTLVVLGEVSGNVSASEKVEIRDGGSVDGDIVSPRVAIAEGAHFRGGVDMQRKSGQQGQASPQQRPAGQPAPQAQAATQVAQPAAR